MKFTTAEATDKPVRGGTKTCSPAPLAHFWTILPRLPTSEPLPPQASLLSCPLWTLTRVCAPSHWSWLGRWQITWKLFPCCTCNRQGFTTGRTAAKGIVSKHKFSWRARFACKQARGIDSCLLLSSRKRHASSDTVQLWDLGSELCKKSCVSKCSLRVPTFAWGLHLSSDAQLQSLPELCLCPATSLTDLDPDPQTSFLVLTSDLPCLYELAWSPRTCPVIPAVRLILDIITSPAPFLLEAP